MSKKASKSSKSKHANEKKEEGFNEKQFKAKMDIVTPFMGKIDGRYRCGTQECCGKMRKLKVMEKNHRAREDQEVNRYFICDECLWVKEINV